MKNLKRVLSLVVACFMLISVCFASNYTYDAGASAFDNNSYIAGVDAIPFIKSMSGCVQGTYNGKKCLQLTGDGAYVEFNTAQAHELAFSDDQANYDLNKVYSLE